MKTDEQVNKAAYRASLGQYGSVHHEEYESTANGFIMGYNQAKNDLEPKWIDVNKELPKHDGDVLICDAKNYNPPLRYFAHFQINDGVGEFYSSATEQDFPTHWMELPEFK